MRTNLTSLFTDIADAIRAKKNTSAQISPQDFASEISTISGGESTSTIEYLNLRGMRNESLFQLLVLFAKASRYDDGTSINVMSGALGFINLAESEPHLIKAIEIDLNERTTLTDFYMGDNLSFTVDGTLIDVMIALSSELGMSISKADFDAIPRITKEEFYSNERPPKLYKIGILSKKDISQFTYNAVDLGLPSGTLWADKNVGATSPEDPGAAFAWGETDGCCLEKKYFTDEELCAFLQPLIGDEMELTPDNIDEFMASILGGTIEDLVAIDYDLYSLGVALPTIELEKYFSSDWSDYFDTTDGGSTFNKYNNTGGFTVLQPEDDAATVNMGSNWRMPTDAEMQELKQYCDYETDVYDTIPYKFTSKINGNSITIPASICVCNGGGYIEDGYDRVWSSELDTDTNYNNYNNKYAKTCYIYNSLAGGYNERRYYGLSVRGVCSK